jgi:hypothetical protein
VFFSCCDNVASGVISIRFTNTRHVMEELGKQEKNKYGQFASSMPN